MTCDCWVSAGFPSAAHISLKMGGGRFTFREPNVWVTTELLALPTTGDLFPMSWQCEGDEKATPGQHLLFGPSQEGMQAFLIILK